MQRHGHCEAVPQAMTSRLQQCQYCVECLAAAVGDFIFAQCLVPTQCPLTASGTSNSAPRARSGPWRQAPHPRSPQGPCRGGSSSSSRRCRRRLPARISFVHNCHEQRMMSGYAATPLRFIQGCMRSEQALLCRSSHCVPSPVVDDEQARLLPCSSSGHQCRHAAALRVKLPQVICKWAAAGEQQSLGGLCTELCV